MTGICGIRPNFGNTLIIHPLGTSLDGFSMREVLYHGHSLDIDWDKKIGFCVSIDNSKEYFNKADDNTVISVEL